METILFEKWLQHIRNFQFISFFISVRNPMLFGKFRTKTFKAGETNWIRFGKEIIFFFNIPARKQFSRF